LRRPLERRVPFASPRLRAGANLAPAASESSTATILDQVAAAEQAGATTKCIHTKELFEESSKPKRQESASDEDETKNNYNDKVKSKLKKPTAFLKKD